MRYIISLLALTVEALGQAGAFDQCGGKDWSDICIAGYTCTFINDEYSQCLSGTAVSAKFRSRGVIKSATVTGNMNNSRPRNSARNSEGRLKWLGVSESAAERGQGKYPGVWGEDFRFPNENAIDALIDEGYNIFRVPFAMERVAYPSMTSSLQTDYLNNLTSIINFITKKGKHAILEPHNFGRYNINDDDNFTAALKWMKGIFGNHSDVFKDTAVFKTFWENLARAFRDNDRVIFTTNNDFRGIDQDSVLQFNQAAIDGIRASGAREQYIMVEGNAWFGARKWISTNDNLKQLRDPQGKIIYEIHQYLDVAGAGIKDDCMTSTIGRDRVASTTRWLRDNKKVGIIGEFAAGANPQCKQAVAGLLDHLQANSDVWMGALWWAAGPWDSEEGRRFSFEPPNGVGFKYYNTLLQKYLP
ncbi:hypothetical protein QQS21_008824 [Conoideocrella luteorostrata]|uniref:cellulase n=1 Tax=Conoideocrella luteorostrata TaxID=1105319 RepID=A0AAJ0CMH7_9HYPO|nr:hypothetical protein QQS21_008824 [Conoideocrella luteorostrata]